MYIYIYAIAAINKYLQSSAACSLRCFDRTSEVLIGSQVLPEAELGVSLFKRQTFVNSIDIMAFVRNQSVCLKTV